MEGPLISIIVPVYNVEAYLPKCVDSLLSQTYTNLEILLIDDGSPDNCGEMCDEYARRDRRVRVFHKENGGLSDARNYGIDRAFGEYLSFVDSDDFVDADYVECLYSLIAKYQVRLSVCQFRALYPNTTKDYRMVKADEKIGTETCLEMMLYDTGNDVTAWGKLYHCTLFETIRYPKGKIFEDTATTYRLIMLCDQIAICYDSKYNYLMRSGSTINQQFRLSYLDSLEFVDSMAEEIVQKYPNLRGAAMRQRVRERFFVLNRMLMSKEFQQEKAEIVSFIRKNGWSVLRDSKAPLKDKCGFLALRISYPLYRWIWSTYNM